MKNQLTTLDGLLLSTASIVGSGIFFLPVLIARQSPSAPLLPWILVALLCLPFVRIFTALTVSHSSGSGIFEAISLRLGRYWGRYAAFTMLFITSFGLPTAALVGGSYAERVLGPGWRMPVALLLIGTAWGQALLGFSVSKRLQAAIIGLTIIALALFAVDERHTLIITQLPSTGGVYAAVLAAPIAFWAFAGMENISFVAYRFANPRIQVPLVMSVTLVVATVLFGAFTLISAHRLDSATEGPALGFADLYPAASSTIALISTMALLMIWSNISAYILALSDLGADVFAITQTRAAMRLGIGYAVGMATTIVLGQDGLPALVTGISCCFVVIYALCLVAYLRLPLSRFNRMLGWSTFSLTAAYLMTFRWGLLMPASMLLVYSLVWRRIRSRAFA